MVGQENTFNSSDLLKYAESLIKESKQQELKYLDQSNYSWLKSRHSMGNDVIEDLEVLKPIIQKMSPESCTSIAVKLDNLDESASPDVIITTFKNLLEEEENIILLGRVREKGMSGKSVRRKVRPVLIPPGRQPVVSFVLDN